MLEPISHGEFALRVCVATLCGVVIGFERARDGKSIGMRTLGLVGLASGLLMAALAQLGAGMDTSGRVIQGLLAGIGFLGAGVVLHGRNDDRPHGITTAAAVWMTSILGTLAGLGVLGGALAGAAVAFAILMLGDHVDRAVQRGPRHRPTDDRGPQ